MSVRPRFRSLLLIVGSSALACTSAQLVEEYSGDALPRPDRVLVYDFAVSPGEVRLDRGISAEIAEAARSAPRSEQELELGHKVADVLAEHLVKQIRDLGLPAQRAQGEPPMMGNSLLIEGYIVSIDQGNRTERIVIGLGAGRSDVETHVRVYETQVGSGTALVELDVSAKGGRTPGAAETLGVGALAGHLIISGAMTVASQTADETLGGTVEADAGRTAKKIAEELKPFFEREGWLDE
jgi:hypothetical protein